MDAPVNRRPPPRRGARPCAPSSSPASLAAPPPTPRRAPPRGPRRRRARRLRPNSTSLSSRNHRLSKRRSKRSPPRPRPRPRRLPRPPPAPSSSSPPPREKRGSRRRRSRSRPRRRWRRLAAGLGSSVHTSERRGGVERRQSELRGVEGGDCERGVGGEMRRQKSLRNRVHHADGVVWGPVYRTHPIARSTAPITFSSGALAVAPMITCDARGGRTGYD